MSTACLIIIGNEILSGRTRDENLAWLATQLNEAGVRLAEARVVADTEKAIIEAVNECRGKFDYVFTTGGIGPTHDDITSGAIARAFGLKLVQNKEAAAILHRHYGDKINEARLSMADMPQGAALIANPVSSAPGFQVENVFVLAGVPMIMRAMFDSLKPTLKGGAPVCSRSLSVFLTEGAIAEELEQIQQRFPDIEIGSYPFVREGRLGTSLVLRAADEKKLAEAGDVLLSYLRTQTDKVVDE